MSEVPYSAKDTMTHFRQSTDEKSRWQKEAEIQGVPLAELIRHAVNEYVRDREQSRKKSKK